MDVAQTILLIAFGSSLVSIVYAVISAYLVMSKDEGTQRMKDIAKAIQEGAYAFLAREYKYIAIVAIVIFVILWALGSVSSHFGLLTALGYLLGAFLSGLAGFIGMVVSVKSNVRTANIAKEGLKKALRLSFTGASVTGFLVTGFGLLAISGFYYISVYLLNNSVDHTIKALIGLAFGTSLISVFARLGGGIYTKAADVGADLVGKVEAGIPEDDPRNPAVIADNVGDNVGDCAGMAADVFETFTVTTVAAMILGHSLFEPKNFMGIAGMLPLLIVSIASVSGVIGTFFVNIGKSGNIMGAFYKGLVATAIISLAVLWFAFNSFIPQTIGQYPTTNIFATSVFGMILTGLIMLITEYYTSYSFSPVKNIAKASVTGHATNIIQGIAVMYKSPALPAIVIALTTYISYKLAGLYGIGIAAASMLSLTGIIISIDSYGPITDNAGGIAEMAELDESVRKVTDPLDAVGNTTKAVTKGFAIGSAALAALVLFAEYIRVLSSSNISSHLSFDLSNPYVIVGLLIGGLLPFYFGAMSMEAVGQAGGLMVEEVRRQFREIKGILEGKAKPDYAACVDIVTKASIKKMVAPGLIPVLAPIIVYFLFGPVALGAMSIGSIVTGFFLAVSMTSGGGAWDNAKKYIEDGNFGGKGSEAHKAAVTGDTVGDPLKDTAGPAINPMIKIINIVAILIVLVFA